MGIEVRADDDSLREIRDLSDGLSKEEIESCRRLAEAEVSRSDLNYKTIVESYFIRNLYHLRESKGMN